MLDFFRSHVPADIGHFNVTHINSSGEREEMNFLPCSESEVLKAREDIAQAIDGALYCLDSYDDYILDYPDEQTGLQSKIEITF